MGMTKKYLFVKIFVLFFIRFVVIFNGRYCITACKPAIQIHICAAFAAKGLVGFDGGFVADGAGHIKA